MRKAFILSAVLLAGCTLVGCSQQHEHRHELDQHGQVFYLDGAGGGGVLTNWGRGVKDGLDRAGYRGDFYNFPWHTGLGVAADQSADVAYKRGKAAVLAAEIDTYAKSHPGAPINIVGLSAGTAVAAFTLEALPADVKVDNVVLLGSSLSNHYDLTQALRHVKDRLYVFTSQNDAVLKFLVSAAGTADRQFCGACSAGLAGFHQPMNSDEGTKTQYAKIETVDWKPEFAKHGNLGGHTDAVNAAFVVDHVAPLLKGQQPHSS